MKTFVEFPFFARIRDEISKIKNEFAKIANESIQKLRTDDPNMMQHLQDYILTDCLSIIDGSTLSKLDLVRQCHQKLSKKLEINEPMGT
jgi:hypothetical protein